MEKNNVTNTKLEGKCEFCHSIENLKSFEMNNEDKALVCSKCWYSHIFPKCGPTMIAYKTFSIEVAHRLPGHPTCDPLHGHSILITVGINGSMDFETKMVIDFKEMKRILKRIVIDKFDHSYLNDLFYMPTAEVMAFYIFRKLEDEGLDVELVRFHETKDNYVEYKKKQ